MALRDNTLALFNATMLRNKREVIESVEDFIKHHHENDNGEEYNAGRRSVIIDFCNKFLEAVRKAEIPTLTKPFFCYEYSLRYDGMRLELCKCDSISFDADGCINESTSTTEQVLVSVLCDCLSVEEYAKVSGVTDVTVRQWIRRGKLRTAKKLGNEWRIPSLSNPPKRGYEPATYRWEVLPKRIQEEFPFLPQNGSVYFVQDIKDKSLFLANIHDSFSSANQEQKMLTSERERLELMLISDDSVEVELLFDSCMYIPAKRNGKLPYLEDTSPCRSDAQIFVKCNPYDFSTFDSSSTPGSDYELYEPNNYIIPISWTFYDAESDEEVIYKACEGDYSECLEIGTLCGNLILNGDIIDNGLDPVEVCDDIDADLGVLMTELCKENGPLNENNGGYLENVLYIHEFEPSQKYTDPDLIHRIIRELPWICKRVYHVRPELIAYFISSFSSKVEASKMREFYECDGFCNLDDSRVMYAYTE